VNWAVERSAFTPDHAESLRAAVDQGDADPVADEVVSVAGDRDPLELYEYLRQVFLRPTDLPDVLMVARQIPFAAALTSNYDDLLERAYGDLGVPVFTPRRSEPLLDAISKRQFFILKLYGTLEQADSVCVAPAQYNEVVRGNLPFARCMETLLFSRTLLFLGSSLEGIESFFQGLSSTKGSAQRRHYALVAVAGRGWEAKAGLLRRRYGIQILPYEPTEGHPQVLEFLKRLRHEMLPEDESIHYPERVETRTSAVKRLRLENIGPFESLDLALHPRWNILLGDNGTGKSTILRALATAIAGEDAAPFAHRLLRSGQTAAAITLETERNTYRTSIRGDSTRAELVSIPGRPLEAEGWLAVGFPALRTVSWNRPKTAETEVRGRPTPADLLPLIQGDPDPRLDKLKQWIVNLDYWSKDERTRTGSPGRYAALIHTFFRIVGEITEGLTILFREVRAQTNEVMIETDDGALPLEAVSQGTTSLMGWVGIVLQRFYEVYGDDEDPTQRPAVVLMDEIDAHLHPEWQRTLIQKLSRIFPNVQFIATTHSPLVVAGLQPEQVFRFARGEDGRVVQLTVDVEMLRGRADQILTGELFGLETTVDPVTGQKMDRYRDLLGKSPRTGDEESELQELQGVLQASIPVRETPPERRAQELLEALLQEQVGHLFPGVQTAVMERATRLFDSLSKERGTLS
jgi:predicted ATPase